MRRCSTWASRLFVFVLLATAAAHNAARAAPAVDNGIPFAFSSDDICTGVPRNTLLASCGPCAYGAACLVYDQNVSTPQLTGCDFDTGSRDAYCSNATGRARTCEFQCFTRLREASTFAFVVPYKAPLSPSTPRRPKPASVAVPTTETAPYQSNVFVRAVGKLDIASTVTNLSIYGGRPDLATKDRVVNMTISATAFAAAPQLTAIALLNLDLGDNVSIALTSMPTRLTSLDLRNTQLKQFPDAELIKFQNLHTLSLSTNALASMNITLPQLNSLDLSDNKLTTFSATAPQLHSLDLSNNNLIAIPPSIFMLTNLRVLNLAKNPIAGPLVLTPAQATFLQALEELKLDVKADTGIPTPQNASGNNANAFTTTIAGVTVLVSTSPDAVITANLTSDPRSSGSGSGSGSTDSDKPPPSVGDIFDGAVSTEPLPTAPPQKPSGIASTGQSSSDSGSSTLLVVLIIVGAIIVVVTGAFGLLWRKRRNAARYNAALYFGSDSYTKMGSEPNDSNSVVSRSVFIGDLPSWADNEMLSYRLRAEDVTDARLIGTGGSAVVWLVSYRGGAHQLASKRLAKTGKATAERMTMLVTEIKLAASLSHPSIVQFFGVAWTNETDLQALFEYMPNGDLRAYLSSNDPFAADWVTDKLRLALDIVEALVYTHSFDPPLIHRDLKSRNVLLSEDFKAKLSDFGCARFGVGVGSETASETEAEAMTDSGGTGRWLAPEILSGSTNYDASSDMYSFGVLLTELDTHLVPYADIVDATTKAPISESTILQQVAQGELQPSVSASCPLVVREIARACLSFHAAHRPTAIQVAYSLRQALNPSST